MERIFAHQCSPSAGWVFDCWGDKCPRILANRASQSERLTLAILHAPPPLRLAWQDHNLRPCSACNAFPEPAWISAPLRGPVRRADRSKRTTRAALRCPFLQGSADRVVITLKIALSKSPHRSLAAARSTPSWRATPSGSCEDGGWRAPAPPCSTVPPR